MGEATLNLRNRRNSKETLITGARPHSDESAEAATDSALIVRDRIEALRAELCRLAELDYADHCAAGGDDLEWTEAASPRHDAFAASLGEEYQMLLAMDENWVGLVESLST